MPEPRPPRPPVREGAVEVEPNPVKPVAAGLLNVFACPNVPKADPKKEKTWEILFFEIICSTHIDLYLMRA